MICINKLENAAGQIKIRDSLISNSDSIFTTAVLESKNYVTSRIKELALFTNNWTNKLIIITLLIQCRG